ncbi:MAG: hypothetical protein C0618_03335 [Desulfuromonas sp.]|nr:MAG: hypothetical protein C0618_03335 [Desulfuromonas sp.]
MPDRPIFINISLLGALFFLVLSSGALQCAYTCMEDGGLRTTRLGSDPHAAHVAGCHLTFPEPAQVVNCPDRSCHQSQSNHRSLGGPVLTGNTLSTAPLLNPSRLPLPTVRSGQVLVQYSPPDSPLLAAWQPPTTPSQTLLSVRTTVLLN